MRRPLYLLLLSIIGAQVCFPSTCLEGRAQAFESIGFYNCYHLSDDPEVIALAKACGYNTYECWDLGWFRGTDLHPQYYADMAQGIQQWQSQGFRVEVILSMNMQQVPAGGGVNPAGGVVAYDPRNETLMQERLNYLRQTVQALNMADGFSIGAGDPGGHASAEPSHYFAMASEMVDIIKQEAPESDIIINTWGISGWDHLPSPYTLDCWEKEALLTREVINYPNLLGPDVDITFPLHNYYRPLALQLYSDAGREPTLVPTAAEVAALKVRGVERLVGWPYFLVGDAEREGVGLSQSETRYIKQLTDNGRQLGLTGMTGNTFVENIFAESLNIYAFAQFCKDPNLTPEQVIGQFAGHLSEPDTADDLASVLKYIENHSTFQGRLPTQYRVPNFDVGALNTPQDAYNKLRAVVLRDQPTLPITGTPEAYVAKLEERLIMLGQEQGQPIVPETHPTFDDFSNNPDLAGSWSVGENYLGANGVLDCSIASGHITWDSVNEILDVSSANDEAVATLHRTGSSRDNDDPVTLTLSNYTYAGDYWTGTGLVVAASPNWNLLSSEDVCYRWTISTNAAETADPFYELKGAGNQILGRHYLSSIPDSVTLKIARDGDDYVFLANGEEIFRDDTHASASLPYYGIMYATSASNTLSARVDDFGVVPSQGLPGDLNGDGFVGGDDLDIVRSFWGQNVEAGNLLEGDPSGDGFVGGDDLDLVRSNWGQGTPPSPQSVPEPGPVGLLLMGGFCMKVAWLTRHAFQEDRTRDYEISWH